MQVAVYDDESIQRQAQLEQARIELARVQSQLDDLTPHAPFDAEVAAVHTAPKVQVAEGTELLTLIDRSSLYASTQIPLSAYREVRGNNTKAWIRVDDNTYPAPVSRLAATSNAGAVAMELSLPEGLPVLINETIELDLALPEIQAYAVPQNALYQGDQLYLINEGRLRAVSVSVLGYQQRNDEQWALVDSDELEGEVTVLTTRLSQPTNGTPVTIVNGANVSSSAEPPERTDAGNSRTETPL